uniref:Uncharacterized protein n=1 Tax=Setaria viridis TaxID=4556 RepID=A0A4U6UM47_SETVI|nr:hypothetical protein SEVIR_5G234480v2 [Setaria viridis]
MAGWRVAGARAVLRRLSAASKTAGRRDGGVLTAICSSSENAPSGLGQCANLFRAQAFASRSIPVNLHQLIRNAVIHLSHVALYGYDYIFCKDNKKGTAILKDVCFSFWCSQMSFI